LLENDQPLGPAHSEHDSIGDLGEGRFSIWNDTIYFSASDNTDPRSNGRSYSLHRITEADDLAATSWTALQTNPKVVELLEGFAHRKDIKSTNRTAGSAPEAGMRTGAIRRIPYPFHVALSVANDCDGMTLASAEKIHRRLEEVHGLRFGDSLWPSGNLADMPSNSCVYFADGSDACRPETARLRAMWHRGWFDSFHSWCDDNVDGESIIADQSFVVDGRIQQELDPGNPAGAWRFGPYGLVVDFVLDDGVEAAALEINDFNGNRHRISLCGELGPMRGWDVADITRSRGVVLFSQERGGNASHRLGRPGNGITSVRLSARGSGRITIRRLAPLAFHRAVVDLQMPVLDTAGMIPGLMICHGGRDFVAAITPKDADRPAWSGRLGVVGAADDPENACYHHDLMAENGIRYIWPASPPYHPDDPAYMVSGAVGAIETWLRKVTARDGRQFYAPPRFLASADNNGLFEADAKPHHNENLGHQLAVAIRQLVKHEGAVALIYMHWSWADTNLRPDQQPFTSDTDAMLAAIAMMQSGQTSAPLPFRVWSPKASVLVRYGAMIQQLADHVSVDENIIFIQPWDDPVLGDSIEFPSFLHGATIYVDDAWKAQLRVGHVPYDVFCRNCSSAEEDDSITIIDDTWPTPILRAVPWDEQVGELAISGGAIDFHSEPRCTRFTPIGVGPMEVRFQPAGLEMQDARYLKLVARKSGNIDHLALCLRFENGTVAVMHEDDELIAGPRLTLPNTWARASVSTAVMDLMDLSACESPEIAPPAGRIVEVLLRFDCDGADCSVDVMEISLLSERAAQLSETLTLGGWMTPARPGVAVHGRAAEWQDSTVSETDGSFLFHGFPKGHATEIWVEAKGQRIWPNGVRRFDPGRHRCDLVINLDGAGLARRSGNDVR
jgi:hypothetical protein